MGLVLIRILFVFLGMLLGYYASTQLYDQVGKMEGMAIGLGVTVLIIFIFIEMRLRLLQKLHKVFR